MDPKFIKILPNPMVKLFAKPYIGGESEDIAIATAQDIYQKSGFLSTLDALGEDVRNYNDINRFVNIYLDVIKKVSKSTIYPNNYIQPSVSLKPSCFIVTEKDEKGILQKDKMDWESCYENIYKICSYAKENNVRVTVEMEDSHWVDFTLKTYFDLLKAGFDNVGTVLQTRLFRSKEDILLFEGNARVRLVIGIYNEPETIALTNKSKMKDLMLEFATILFRKGAFVEFATHDEDYIRRFISEVVIPMDISPEKYEVQMLVGVPREKFQQKMTSGELIKELDKNTRYTHDSKINFRLYIPFAQSWDNAIAYCKRRLIENPNIVLYTLKNLIM